MTNYYLKGFKLGFQPGRHTAEKVYRAIIKRKPDFLDKQVPAQLSKVQIQHLGQFEGEFLTSEVTFEQHDVVFSALAQELLFSDRAALDLDLSAVYEQQPVLSAAAKTAVTPEATVNAPQPSQIQPSQKEDELSW